MPSAPSGPFFHLDYATIQAILRPSKNGEKRQKTKSGGLMKFFKLFPMLASGSKMVALLGRPKKFLPKDHATAVTLYGYRKGRIELAIHEDAHCQPVFVIELPIHTTLFHKELSSDVVRIALESQTKTHRKKLLEEFVWVVYCNGRKIGYCIRKKQPSEDDVYVMNLLKGVSMGAGVLPSPNSDVKSAERDSGDGDLTYIRARFERVSGSKDSEAYYMINPDGPTGPELSIFFLRSQ